MSGTSLDAIDAALVRVEGEGLDMRAEVVRVASRPLGALGKLLRPLARQRRRTSAQLAVLGMKLGEAHAKLLHELLGDEKADLIAVHGQTIYHEAPVSMQLLNPHPIACQIGVPVVFDLRGADLAAGGQGAPITPLADHVLFRDRQHTRAVVNLGGFANFTWLPPSQRDGEEALHSIRGGDICVCNQLLDTIARRCFHRPYDRDGRRAMKGEADEDAHCALLPILRSQAEAGRSLGNGDELSEWVDVFFDDCSGPVLARTAAMAIAQVIAAAVGETDQLVLAGGGTRNQALRREITDAADAPVCLSDDLGVPAQYREAIAMSVLGALCADRVPITLPQITGCASGPPVAGCWIYP